MPPVHLEAVERISAGTPRSGYKDISALCRGLSPEHEPRYVDALPEPGAQIGECFRPAILASMAFRLPDRRLVDVESVPVGR